MAHLYSLTKKTRIVVGKGYSDFYAEGAKSARMGNTRSPDNEYRMPVFGTGLSWQAKAFAQGFCDECAKLGRQVLPG